jgi:hypothetical protein
MKKTRLKIKFIFVTSEEINNQIEELISEHIAQKIFDSPEFQEKLMKKGDMS